ncbi:hypothetical protein OAA83_03385, partial [Candidatus Marinimicrobia bacterium]|nr:hypothetical protein [Candidatus Neomarinimicrobiota bacterium]
KTEALKDLGGVTALWQLAFDGYKNYESKINSDLLFCFSQWSVDLEKKLNSKINYAIITGYCKDHVFNEKSSKVTSIKNNFNKVGVKKIISIFDENSHDDYRWHTGHELQQENYYFILKKLLSTPSLGIVFKPKNVKNLKERLGPVWNLLLEGLQTNRCYIFNEFGAETTSASSSLAASIADLCIHGHMCSGTAALEAALSGKSTIMIDREGTPQTKFNILPKDKIIFSNWETAIEASMEFLFKDKKSLIGNWDAYLNHFDPFRDGKASLRIGEYLEWLLIELKNGNSRSLAMELSAEKYSEIWGSKYVKRL